MEISAVTAGIQIAEKAWKALETVRERAKTSKDIVLKNDVNELFDQFLDLKSAIVRLTEENSELRRTLSDKHLKPEIRQVGDANYYFVGEHGPYCQPCYDNNSKLVNLTPRRDSSDGHVGRQCLVCHHNFTEVKARPQREQISRNYWS